MDLHQDLTMLNVFHSFINVEMINFVLYNKILFVQIIIFFFLLELSQISYKISGIQFIIADEFRSLF